MKINRPAYRLAISLFLLVSAAISASPLMAQTGSTTATVRFGAEANAQTVRIEATATAGFEYSVSRPSPNLLMVDIPGVATSDSSSARVLDSNVVSSYRVVSQNVNGQPGVRLEVMLRTSVDPRFERTGPNQLALIFEGTQPQATTRNSEPSQDQQGQESIAPLAIRGVQVGKADAQTNVRIDGTGRLEYQAVHLSNPERVVLDFSGARLAVNSSAMPGGVRPVSRVRVSQYKPDVARVVIDLDKAVPYSTRVEGNSITVAFSSADDSSHGAKSVASSPREGRTAQPAAMKTAAAPGLSHQEKTPLQKPDEDARPEQGQSKGAATTESS